MLASLNCDLFGFVFLSKLIENFSMNEYEGVAYVAFPSFIFSVHGKLLEVF